MKAPLCDVCLAAGQAVIAGMAVGFKGMPRVNLCAEHCELRMRDQAHQSDVIAAGWTGAQKLVEQAATACKQEAARERAYLRQAGR